MMKIELLYLPNCSYHQHALGFIKTALLETGIDAEVVAVLIKTEADAQELHFVGSPTVRVDEVDIEPQVVLGNHQYGLQCRLYYQDDLIAGYPAYEDILETIEIGYLVQKGMLSKCC